MREVLAQCLSITHLDVGVQQGRDFSCQVLPAADDIPELRPSAFRRPASSRSNTVNLMPKNGQRVGGRQPGRPGADDGDPGSILAGAGNRRNLIDGTT